MREQLEDSLGLTGYSIEGKRYQIGGVLGVGGFATVYEGLDRDLGVKVAIKVLTSSSVVSPDLIDRFKLEAKYLAGFRQKSHIINLLSYGTETVRDGLEIHYYVMPYLERSLRDVISGMTELDGMNKTTWRIWYRVAVQIAKALNVMHGRAFYHRDVKPENILIDEDGNYLLSDFGLVKQGLRFGPSIPSLHAGTPQYMSPEQMAGKALDRRTDIFSLGVVLFELAAGQLPEMGVPLLEQLELSHPLQQEIILKCMERHKKARYQSAKELLKILLNVRPAEIEKSFVDMPKKTQTLPTLTLAGNEMGERGRRRTSVKAPAVKTALGFALSGLLFLQSHFISGGEHGFLKLSSFPAGAEIFVNDRELSKFTPAVIGPIREERYNIAIRRAGYLPWQGVVEIHGDKTSEVRATLTPIKKRSAGLKIESVPSGAKIFIDGRDARMRTPVTIRGLSKGAHRVRLQKSGFAEAERVIQIEKDQVYKIQAELTKESGSLLVDSEPRGAEIFLNGRSTQRKTPYVFSSLAPNDYTIQLRLGGYRDKFAAVSIKSDMQKDVSLVLQNSF